MVGRVASSRVWFVNGPMIPTSTYICCTVIPGRDPETLEPRGHYFVLFSTDAAARAYRDRVIRLHRISKTWTPTSITSPLPPPPGYLKDGEDIHALMQAFTIIPSS